MDVTPKINRRGSLTLRRSRHGSSQGSPRNGLLSKLLATDSLPKEPPSSPTVMKLSSLNKDIEYTPPNKRLNLNNSDFSPKLFDTSCSPNELLSQTMTVDSPEVGWSWNNKRKQSYTKIDAASSSTTGENVKRKTQQTESQQNMRLAYQLRREARDTQIASERRRAEKDRADDLLQKRCAKLREQLEVSKNKSTETKLKELPETASCSFTSTPNAGRSTQPEKSEKFEKGNELNDFFNDSETDDFLLEATQSLEAKMVEMTQKTPTNPAKCGSKPTENNYSANASENKRSSLYMKFLEDDSIDDWFESLDDILQQTAQDKKPRSPFQRYKSMPVQATSDATRAVTRSATTITKVAITNAEDTRSIKRHASTHTISPHTSNYRGHQLHMRK